MGGSDLHVQETQPLDMRTSRLVTQCYHPPVPTHSGPTLISLDEPSITVVGSYHFVGATATPSAGFLLDRKVPARSVLSTPSASSFVYPSGYLEQANWKRPSRPSSSKRQSTSRPALSRCLIDQSQLKFSCPTGSEELPLNNPTRVPPKLRSCPIPSVVSGGNSAVVSTVARACCSSRA